MDTNVSWEFLPPFSRLKQQPVNGGNKMGIPVWMKKELIVVEFEGVPQPGRTKKKPRKSQSGWFVLRIEILNQDFSKHKADFQPTGPWRFASAGFGHPSSLFWRTKIVGHLAAFYLSLPMKLSMSRYFSNCQFSWASSLPLAEGKANILNSVTLWEGASCLV